ncbi:MAG: carbamoyl-phosphate synthase large subunit [Porphyrobacter sp.]|nr:carbamoyl-phosphate synthase large subunit [Porphyrobacter sp.]
MTLRRAAMLALLLGAAPASAQDAAWSEARMLGGRLEFRGQGGITGQGDRSLSFWRPLTYPLGKKKRLGGRMDCALSAIDMPFYDAAFDLDVRYAAEAKSRHDQRYRDKDPVRDFSPTARRLDVEGVRFNPHQHYVLSLIALRQGGSLYDVRMNCTFAHDGYVDPKVSYRELVHRYTDIALAPTASKPVPKARS